jgi:DNA polymerase-3 subunit gamma/tau
MSYQVLARKYRPQSFADVVAQDHVTRSLMNALAAGRVAHGILFTGPRGTGKTTVARILAKALNCEAGPAPEPCNRCRSCGEITAGNGVDVLEIDGASNNGVEQIRELRETIKYMPARSRHKITIIDEVHMLSTPAFNALLKTLEEPPAHVLFMFATTEPHKIPITILSRCQRYDFRRVRAGVIADHLERVCGREGVSIDRESLELIAREAAGSIRDALSLLDQVLAAAAGAGGYRQVLELLGAVDRHQLHALAAAILARDAPAFLAVLDEVFDRGHDLKKLYADLLELLRDILVVQTCETPQAAMDLPAHEIERVREVAALAPPDEVHQALGLLFQEEAAVRLSPRPRLAVEMAFFKIHRAPRMVAIDTLIERLEALRGEIGPAAAPPPPAANAAAPPPSAAPGAAPPPDPAEGAGKPPERPEALWAEILERVGREQPSLAANLKRASLGRTEPGRIEVVVPENHFAFGVLKREKNLALLRRICSDILGQPQEVAIAGGPEEGAGRAGRRDQNRRLEHRTLSHPLVTDSIEIFKGKFLGVQVIEEDEA